MKLKLMLPLLLLLFLGCKKQVDYCKQPPEVSAFLPYCTEIIPGRSTVLTFDLTLEESSKQTNALYSFSMPDYFKNPKGRVVDITRNIFYSYTLKNPFDAPTSPVTITAFGFNDCGKSEELTATLNYFTDGALIRMGGFSFGDEHRKNPALCADDRRIYKFWGEQNGSPSTLMEVYNIETDQFEASVDLNVANPIQSNADISGNMIYATGDANTHFYQINKNTGSCQAINLTGVTADFSAQNTKVKCIGDFVYFSPVEVNGAVTTLKYNTTNGVHSTLGVLPINNTINAQFDFPGLNNTWKIYVSSMQQIEIDLLNDSQQLTSPFYASSDLRIAFENQENTYYSTSATCKSRNNISLVETTKILKRDYTDVTSNQQVNCTLDMPAIYFNYSNEKVFFYKEFPVVYSSDGALSNGLMYGVLFK